MAKPMLCRNWRFTNVRCVATAYSIGGVGQDSGPIASIRQALAADAEKPRRANRRQLSRRGARLTVIDLLHVFWWQRGSQHRHVGRRQSACRGGGQPRVRA